MKYKKDFKERFGVSISTARTRLIKSLLFKLLNENDKNKCFRCNLTMTLEDFSIEHVKPWAWEENGFQLFMDTENVSFSHSYCNSKYIRKSITRTKRKTNGMLAKCSGCEEWKDRALFNKNKANISGLQAKCIECRKKERKGV